MFYGTFGLGTNFAKKHQPLDTKDLGTAREMMFKLYGRSFCTVYDEESFKTIQEKYPTESLEVVSEDILKQQPSGLRYVKCHSCGKKIIENKDCCFVRNGHIFCSVKCLCDSIDFMYQLFDESTECCDEIFELGLKESEIHEN